MNCEHCGAPIEKNDKICPYCGSAVSIDVDKFEKKVTSLLSLLKFLLSKISVI